MSKDQKAPPPPPRPQEPRLIKESQQPTQPASRPTPKTKN